MLREREHNRLAGVKRTDLTKNIDEPGVQISASWRPIENVEENFVFRQHERVSRRERQKLEKIRMKSTEIRKEREISERKLIYRKGLLK